MPEANPAMFLFTTPAHTPTAASGQPVTQALRSASTTSGVPFEFLLATAKRESGLNPSAKASSSSARGLFQFVEQTWLGLVRETGASTGLAEEASQISAGGRGRFTVAGHGARERILALRNDPDVAAGMAAVLARKNFDGLSKSLGRAPSQGELYIAHFLGLGGASRFIRAATETPQGSAAAQFPQAAEANEAIFYDKAGRERSLSAVYAVLVKGFEGTAATPTPMAEPPVAQLADAGGNAFHGLFQTSARKGGAGWFTGGAATPAGEAVGMPLDLLSFRSKQG